MTGCGNPLQKRDLNLPKHDGLFVKLLFASQKNEKDILDLFCTSSIWSDRTCVAGRKRLDDDTILRNAWTFENGPGRDSHYVPMIREVWKQSPGIKANLGGRSWSILIGVTFIAMAGIGLGLYAESDITLWLSVIFAVAAQAILVRVAYRRI